MENYDSASDMWSVGCIIYELLIHHQSDFVDAKRAENRESEKPILFQGESCFPLSPCDQNSNDELENSQLKVSNND